MQAFEEERNQARSRRSLSALGYLSPIDEEREALARPETSNP